MITMENKKFIAAGIKWTVIDKTEDGFFCIADEVEKNMEFGLHNNNWKNSLIREWCIHLEKKIEREFGVELPFFERNLLSLDGEDDYGTCKDKVSLLTLDEYRKYKKVIPKIKKWWWLITPDSTSSGWSDKWNSVVSPSGSINHYNYDSSNGVRPVCIFPSSIFESDEGCVI